MKKSLLSILAISLMMVSCGNSKAPANATADTNSENNVDADTAAEVTPVKSSECVVSGDVVFVDLDYVMAASKLNAIDGVALETAMNEFQQKLTKAKQTNDTKMANLMAERDKLEAEVAKLNDEYAKGFITSLDAQKKQDEIQTKAATWEEKMTNYQKTALKEEENYAKQEQDLNERYMVLLNKFKKLASLAIDEINADGRYKMIINAVSVVDADPALNISNLVLERVDALYEAGALEL